MKLTLLGLLALASALTALLTGASALGPLDLIGALADASSPSHDVARAVVFDLRMPRVVASAVVGAALSLAGLLLQATTHNPLADPYLVGTSAGATLAMVLVGSVGLPATALGHALLPLVAFVGALGAVRVVFSLARAGGPATPTKVLLAGLVVTAFAGAATSFVLYRFDAARLRSAALWMMGGVSVGGLGETLPALLVLAVATLFAARRAHDLDALALGDEAARGLGAAVETLVPRAVWASAALCAVAVALAGILGFVGLLVPHALRALVGRAHRALVPASVLGGAAFLCLADVGARVLVAPAELPLGILTALAGAPMLLALLRRETATPLQATPASSPHMRTMPAAGEPATDPPASSCAALSARGLGVRYGARRALEPCDLDVQTGEILCVLGPNGAGKSTLLRALCGATPSDGRVLLDGRDLRACAPAERARSVVLLPQHTSPDEATTVLELVTLGRTPHLARQSSPWRTATLTAVDRAAIAAALDTLDATSLAARPLGTLSGGERRRALLAMILATEARVLLLDEPLVALDLPHQVALFRILGRLARERGVALVLTLHDLALALRLGDRVALVDRGRLLRVADAATLVASGLLQQVFGEDVDAFVPQLGAPHLDSPVCVK